MGAVRQRTNRPRGTARRQALIEATLQIVAEVGPDAVTHRRVAEVAGLPLASTTYWFDSKEDLLTAALRHAAERDICRLEASAAVVGPTKDPIGAAVAAVIDEVDVRIPTSRASLLASYTLVLEAARRPSLRDLARKWTTAYLDVLEPLLAAAGSTRPRSDAELLLMAADGLLLDQLALGDTFDPAPRLRRLTAALVAHG